MYTCELKRFFIIFWNGLKATEDTEKKTMTLCDLHALRA